MIARKGEGHFSRCVESCETLNRPLVMFKKSLVGNQAFSHLISIIKNHI